MTSLPTAGRSQHSVYTGRTTSWPTVATTCVGALLIVFMGKESNGAWGGPVFVVPLILVARARQRDDGFQRPRDRRAERLHYPLGAGRMARCTYRLDEIEQAEVIDLAWWRVSYGFWWTPKRTNCTVRSGPTVQNSLRSRRVVTITVPEPAAAVTALREASADGQLGHASTPPAES